jgi:GT2 family glycosyltransferase
MVAVIVPVLYNFEGLEKLKASVDVDVEFIVIDNSVNNAGVAAAWNKGLSSAAEHDVAIIANDDVVLHPGTIDKLIDASADFDLISAVASPDPNQGPVEHPFPDFACYAVKPTEFVERFGLFDENFYPAYFEDNDMAYRIKLGGGKQGVHMSAGMDHVGSATQFWGGGRVVSHEKFEENRAYFVGKWGGRPHEEVYSQPFNGLTGRTYKEWL